ncbi:acety-l/propionyl-CoA carboxylase subunit alpha, partial [Streptomyces beijiangensis]|nr:acety-l/propionyl-CoA carboxylase subunit alpha [Streptomyces beijiangensis]
GAWRNLHSQPQIKRYRTEPDGTEHEVRYRHTRDGLTAEADGVRVVLATPTRVVLEVDGVQHPFTVTAHADRVHVDATTLTPL